MRKLFNFWALILCALAVVGCEKPQVDDEGKEPQPTPGVKPEITLEQEAVDFNSFTFKVTTTAEGELGYLVLADEFSAPNMTEWFAHNTAEVKDSASITVEGLKDNTSYTLYTVLRAKADGALSSPKTLKFTTPDDGVVSPISVDNVTFESITFTINIDGSYVFQCIDKAYLEYVNKTPQEYIHTAGIGIPSQGAQTIEWIEGGMYGVQEMRVRDDSDYYIIAAITNGSTITDQIFVEQTRTPKKPHSNAGLTTEIKQTTSTSVTIATTPDDNVVKYYVYVKDKATVDSIVAQFGEAMLTNGIKSPNQYKWELTTVNEDTWGGLTPATDYYCCVLIQDKAGAEALSLIDFRTKDASSAAPTIELSLTQPEKNSHNTLSLNIFSKDAASVRIAFNTKADISILRNKDYDDDYILKNYGMDLTSEQVEAIRTTGLSIPMEDLYPEVDYIALVRVMNIENTPTIKASTEATTKRPVPARVESDLFTKLQGEWEVSYDLIQFNKVNVSIYGQRVIIAQGVDETTEKMYREQNRLVILEWPFNVYGPGNYEHIPTMKPAKLMEEMPEYWGKYPQLAYRDYGPKIFLEIAADGSLSVPSERGEYLYNWSSDGTFYFYGADQANAFTAPATFPVTLSEDGNTMIIGASVPVEEFGFGVYRPSVFLNNYDLRALATSDIILQRVK